MAKVIYDIYKVTNDQSPVFGRHFGRVVHTETMDTEMLAQHIAEHGSPYTEDVVSGVLKKAEKCILEQLLDSKKVKLDGLGTFYLSAQNAKGGAAKVEDFSVTKNLKGLKGGGLQRDEEPEGSAPALPARPVGLEEPDRQVVVPQGQLHMG